MKNLRDSNHQMKVPQGNEQPEESIELAESLISEARNHEVQWQYEEAEAAYRKAFSVLERLRGSGHVMTIRCGISLGILHQIQGKDDAAETLYLDLVTRLNLFEQGHYPEAVQILSTLCEMYEEQVRLIELEAAKRQQLQLKQEMLGSDHIEVGQLLWELAEIYESLKFIIKEENCLRAAFAIMRKTLGPSNERTTTCLKKLAAVQEKLRRQMELTQDDIEWQG